MAFLPRVTISKWVNDKLFRGNYSGPLYVQLREGDSIPIDDGTMARLVNWGKWIRFWHGPAVIKITWNMGGRWQCRPIDIIDPWKEES